MELVSIIIPTYNHAHFISDAVNSCLEQTYPNIEIIVVDDGSTDNTQQVLEPYSSQIKYIYQKNAGPAAARNNGARASNGNYLLFLDSDDWLSSEQIALQIIELNKRPEYGLVYSAWKNVDETSKQIIGEVRPKTEGDVLKKLLLRELFFSPGAALIRKKCFDKGRLRLRKEKNSCVPKIQKCGLGLRLQTTALLIWMNPYSFIESSKTVFPMITQAMQKANLQDWKNFSSVTDLDKAIMEMKSIAFSLIHFEYFCKILQ